MIQYSSNEWSSLSNETAKADTVAGISILTAFLSFIGSGSVLVCSVYHKRVLYPEIFPTFHLAVADVLASFFLIISSITFFVDISENGESELACAVFSGLIISFYTTTFLLTIVYAMEALFRFRRRLRNGVNIDPLSVKAVSSYWMYLAYISAWLLPLVLASFLIVKTLRQKAGTCSMCFADFRFDEKSCWTPEDNAYLRYLTRLFFLVPLLFVMLVNMFLYILIMKTYRRVVLSRGLLSYHQRQEERLLRRKTCFYQAVFFICWLPSIIVGSASFSDDYTMLKFYPGLIFQVILGPLQGLLNSIVYGWQRDSFRRALTERTSLLSTNRTSMIFSRTQGLLENHMPPGSKEASRKLGQDNFGI